VTSVDRRGGSAAAFMALTCVSACVFVSSGPKGGRRITPAGQKDMDLIAGRTECTLPSYGL
jgi:hypothetical protein